MWSSTHYACRKGGLTMMGIRNSRRMPRDNQTHYWLTQRPRIPVRWNTTESSSTQATRSRRTRWIPVAVVAVGTYAYYGYSTRQARMQRIRQLPTVQFRDDEKQSPKMDDATIIRWSSLYPHRSLPDLIETVQRVGLMKGSSKTEGPRQRRLELQAIRNWHTNHGYKGGLVVRDLTKPLFRWPHYHDQHTANDDNHSADTTDCEDEEEECTTLSEILEDPTVLERRECYYLYYEVTPTGEIRQEIFCRGVTLPIDILTCLQAWMAPLVSNNHKNENKKNKKQSSTTQRDESKIDNKPGTDIYVHRGFRNQADRIFEDVKPLLASPSDARATVRVCGHSLGGAVATLLAAKLRLAGYKVTQVTTIGEPRFCASYKDAQKLQRILPKDHLRIEHELDFVPFLSPLWAHHSLANRLWIVNTGEYAQEPSVRLVLADGQGDSVGWTDAVWDNFLFWETVRTHGDPHRIPNHVKILQKQWQFKD